MKTIEKILDVIELYVPMVSFTVMFISYIVLILYRYIFYASIQWLNELSIIAYSWSAVFCYSYCERKKQSVSFTIIYDKFSERMQNIVRIIGDLFIIATFSILLPYAYDFVTFMQIKKTSVMKIKFSYVYMPVLFFIALTDLHYVVRLINDIKSLVKGPNSKVPEEEKQ